MRAAEADSVRGGLGRGEALVPVPTHPLKRFLRGWEPVEELAARLSARLPQHPGLRVRKLLWKARWTRPQVGQVGADRRKYPARVFRLRRGQVPPATVLLLDNVLTTGTTASECARALRQGGAREVMVLAVARAPAPQGQAGGPGGN